MRTVSHLEMAHSAPFILAQTVQTRGEGGAVTVERIMGFGERSKALPILIRMVFSVSVF